MPVDWSILLAALVQVESGGDCSAVGDNGKAYGPLQIHAAVVEDVNRIYDRGFRHDDCISSGWEGHSVYRDQLATSVSRDICHMYLVYWGARYEGTTGMEPTYEVYARIWNGGPKGYDKMCTVGYGLKVMRVAREISDESKK